MNRQQRPITDRELKAWLAAGPVDRGVGEGLTFVASTTAAQAGKASWILRFRLNGRFKEKVLGLAVECEPQRANMTGGGTSRAASVKLSIRMTAAEAQQVGAGARAAGMSRGAYLAGLIATQHRRHPDHLGRPPVLSGQPRRQGEAATTPQWRRCPTARSCNPQTHRGDGGPSCAASDGQGDGRRTRHEGHRRALPLHQQERAP
ncbi:MAG: hypothetical protein WAQ05_10040 [Rubrivivax sp.]